MSRSRNIKPGFFKNDLLAECQPLARILFAGLWCEADREGRLEDRPKRIKNDCLGYDDCDVDALLSELAVRGFITRYVVDGKAYIAVNEFSKHQNPHAREQASVIPAPTVASNNQGSDKAQPKHEPAEKCTGSAVLIPDSPSLIPDSPSLIPDSPSLIPEPIKELPPTAAEIADPIFGTGLDFLKRKGLAESPARSFLGLLRKELRDDLTVAELLVEAERQDVSDPCAWLRAATKNRKARAGPKYPQPKTVQAMHTLEGMKSHVDSKSHIGSDAAADLPRIGGPASG